MISDLAKYYRIAKIEFPDEEYLQKRLKSIEEIIKAKQVAWILDCIRFYLQKPVKNKNFEKELIQVIQKHDSLFPEEGRSLELQVFAGAVVKESINKSKEKDIVAGALKSGVFGVPKEIILHSDVVLFAIDHLDNKAITIREDHALPKNSFTPPVFKKDATITVEALTEMVKGLLSYTKSISERSEQMHGIMADKIAVLEEESDIHWWLFRSYSNKKQCPVSELNVIEAIFILSSELHDLIRKFPAPNNIDEFLKKIWADVQHKLNEVSIKEAIEVLFTKLENKIDDQQTKYEVYGNLAPLHLAFIKSKESGGDQLWTALFEKSTGIKADFKINPFQLCTQFLAELILIELK